MPSNETKKTDFRDRVVEFLRVPASALIANPKNWRTHPPRQRKAREAVLSEIGFAGATLARRGPDGGLVLIDGHLRREVAGDQAVPVLVLDVDEQEADAILATHDPIGAMAGTDDAALAKMIDSVQISHEALAETLQRCAQAAKLNTLAASGLESETPEPPDNPVTKRGDLWTLGRHRLLCGDSSSHAELDRLLDGAVIHLVNTDPPYNVKVEPRSNNAIAAGLSSFQGTSHHQSFDFARHPQRAKGTTAKMRAKDRPLANDFVSDAEFDALLDAWFGNIARVLEPGRGFYIWGGYANCANYPPVLKRHGLYFSQAIIWTKGHPVLTRKDFMGNHEWCFYGWKEGAPHVFYGPNNATDVWEVQKIAPVNMVHLTEKPVELAARAIGYSSLINENVLDLFGGSGSTLMAAEQTSRRAFLMEMDEAYCDVIVTRWENATCQKATRESVASQ